MNHGLMVAALCCLFVAGASAVSITTSTDHVTTGDTVSVSIQDLMDNSVFTFRITGTFLVSPGGAFLFEADNYQMPFSLQPGNIRVTMQNTDLNIFTIKKGDTELQRTGTSVGGTYSFTMDSDISSGTYDFMKMSGTALPGADTVIVSLEMNGTKSGPENSTISFLVGATEPGTVLVNVSVNGSTELLKTIMVPPVVTGIHPATAAQGATILITNLSGSHFVPGSSTTIVTLNRTGQSEITSTNLTIITPSRITCNFTIPAGAVTGPWNVTVTNPDGQSGTLVNGFTISVLTIRHNAVFRPSAWNNWIFTRDLATLEYRDHYGMAGDKPLVADFNNDGVMDRAVFRASAWNNWIFDYGMNKTVFPRNHYGMDGDIPLAGYFNSDPIPDRAVFRNGWWIVDDSTDGTVNSRTWYGMAADIPLIGDFNNDGTPDRAVFRASAWENWIFDYGMDGTVDLRNHYGQSGDIPMIGDFNLDGITDRAVFRSGEWMIDYNMDGTVDARKNFGLQGDTPVGWNL